MIFFKTPFPNLFRVPPRFSLVALMTLQAVAMGHAQNNFAYRQQQLLKYSVNFAPNISQTGASPNRIGRTGFWDGEGRLWQGDYSNATNFIAYAISDSCDYYESGFSLWAGMDCLWRMGNTYYTPSLLSSTYVNYDYCMHYGDGGTANLQFMGATAFYLAYTNALFAGADFSNALAQTYGASYGTGDFTGRTFLLNQIQSVVHYGLQEQNSAIYEHFTLGPIRSLADFAATDPEMQNKAQFAWEWGVAEAAGTWLNGHWCIPSGRGYQSTVANTLASSLYPWWLMFGGPTPVAVTNYSDSGPVCSMLYAASTFGGALPEVVAAATTRNQSYTHHTTTMRNYSSHNIVAYKQSWMTPHYSLFSESEAEASFNSDWSFNFNNAYNYSPAVLPDANERQRWGILWDDPNPAADAGVWLTNPAYPFTSYDGTTLNEKTYQYQDTLIGVYNIPNNTSTLQYLYAHIPSGALAIVNESSTYGRVFLHYNNILIALQLSSTFTWDGSATYLTINGNKFGLAIETAAQTEYTNSTASARLNAFRSDVLTRGSFNTAYVNTTTPTMVYTNRHGNSFYYQFGACPIQDGKTVDFLQWPTLSNPWMYQPIVGNLYVFGTNRTILYDYNDWVKITNNAPAVSTPVAFFGTNGVMSLDLTKHIADVETPGSNLIYSVTGATGGAATLLADGQTLQFTPTNNNGAGSATIVTTDRGIDSRLVLYYGCGSSNALGASLYDDSLNGRTATVQTFGGGNAAFVSDSPSLLRNPSSQSIRLYSTNTSGARLTSTITAGNLNMINADWTVSTWFKRATANNEDFIFYVGNGDGDGGDGDALQLICPGLANTVVLTHYNTGGTADATLTSPATVTNNTWHHVTVTFHETADNKGNLGLWLDGASVGVVSNLTWSLVQTNPLVFGGHSSTVNNLSRYFNGWLDEVALFRGALSSNEISRLATMSVASFGGFTVTNTLTIGVPTATEVPIASVTASSVLAGFPPANAVDGDTNSFWASATPPVNQWLQVTFPRQVAVSRFQVIAPAGYGPKSVQLFFNGSTSYSNTMSSSGVWDVTVSPPLYATNAYLYIYNSYYTNNFALVSELNFFETAPPGTFADWQLQNFSAAQLTNNSYNSPTADPDSDGVRNLLEFACGGNPLSADATNAAVSASMVPANQFAFYFRERTGLMDITRQFQTSFNLVNWTSAAPASVSILQSFGAVSLYQALFGIPAGTNGCYYRLGYDLK